MTFTLSKGFWGHFSTLRQSNAIQHPTIITQNLTAVFFSCLIHKYIFRLKLTKTSMLIWENNPLTLKFLVTSFGIAVSLYTSFSEIGLYTFKRILTSLLFCSFFTICVFFCLLQFFKYRPSLKALLQSDRVRSYTSKITTTTTSVFETAGLLRLLCRPAQPVC